MEQVCKLRNLCIFEARLPTKDLNSMRSAVIVFLLGILQYPAIWYRVHKYGADGLFIHISFSSTIYDLVRELTTLSFASSIISSLGNLRPRPTPPRPLLPNTLLPPPPEPLLPNTLHPLPSLRLLLRLLPPLHPLPPAHPLPPHLPLLPPLLREIPMLRDWCGVPRLVGGLQL